jgi:hypothetical protein
VAKRLLQAAAVPLLTLALLEGALQLAAWLAPGILSRVPASASGEAIRILCVGDSHTYGAGAAVLESYPRRVQEILAQRYPQLRFEAQNRGIPGANSAYVANRLERQIAELRPDLVIVWVGINNSWNSTETEDWAVGGPWSRLQRFALRSRLVRLALVAWVTRPGATPLEPTREERLAMRRGDLPGRRGDRFERRDEPLTDDAAYRRLDFDLARIAETARAHATPLLFLNYPYAFAPEVRAAVRTAGERLRVPVVDTLQDAARARKAGVNPIFVWGAGYHPSGALYGYIAESVANAAALALALPEAPLETGR